VGVLASLLHGQAAVADDSSHDEACRAAGLDHVDEDVYAVLRVPLVVPTQVCPLADGTTILNGNIGAQISGPEVAVWGEAFSSDGTTTEIAVYRDPDTGDVTVLAGPVDTDAVKGGLGLGATGSPGACSDGAYAVQAWRRTTGFTWYFNGTNHPGSISPQEARDAAIAAGSNIVDTDNNCGKATNYLPISQTHGGPTYNHPAITRETCNAQTVGSASLAENVISFESGLAANTLALACTWSRTNSTTTNRMNSYGSDIKIDSTSRLWYAYTHPPGCSNQYDLDAVLTHEFGHVFGMAHVSETTHANLTMSAKTTACDESARSLGLGDWRNMDTSY
jgi:hypothetical protein